MSFILDALRKSESQRRLEAVPDIMRVPMAVRRERLPMWAVAVMAMLALALVAALVAGWLSQQTRTAAAGAVAMQAAEETAAVPSEATVTAPPAAVRALDPRPESPAETRLPAETAAPVVAPSPPPRQSPAAPAEPRRATIEPSSLPSFAALQAAGLAIPNLDLQLLVTSNTRANRLVVINGKRYREGERLVEGPEVVEIVAEGAVLRHAGRDFLLVTD